MDLATTFGPGVITPEELSLVPAGAFSPRHLGRIRFTIDPASSPRGVDGYSPDSDVEADLALLARGLPWIWAPGRGPTAECSDKAPPLPVMMPVAVRWSGAIAPSRVEPLRPIWKFDVASPVLLTWQAAGVLLLSIGILRAEVPAMLPGGPHPIESAGRDVPRPITLTLFSDNDSVYYKPNDDSDRQYTAGNGFAIDLQHPWADALAPYAPCADRFPRASTGMGILAYHLIHTPDKLRRRAPIPNDRPYSGHFNFSAFWQRVNASRTTADHFQVDMGFVGPSAAGEPIQKWIHRIFDAQEPMGWNNQVVDEVTINARIRKKWRALKNPTEDPTTGPRIDLIPQVGVDAGTVRTAFDAQITGRIGVNMPDDFGPASTFDLGDATSRPREGLGFSVFGSAAGSIVLHDIHLDGTVFRSSPVTVDSAPLVGAFRAGAEITHVHDAWSLTLGYSQTWLTEQFSAMSTHHAYGSWTMSFDLEF